MLTIASLPDLCLLMIFDNLTLNDLCPGTLLTCRRWNSLQISALARRRSLSLLLKSGQQHSSKDKERSELIVLHQLTQRNVNYLLACFPNITRLELHSVNDVHLDPMTIETLFSGLGTSLTSLTVSECRFNPQTTLSWLGSINDLTLLRYLSITIMNGSPDIDKVKLPLLATSTRLCKFALNILSWTVFDFCKWLADCVRHAGGGGNFASDALEIQIGSWEINLSPHELEQIYSISSAGVAPPPWLSRIGGSFPLPLKLTYPSLYRFCGAFRGLSRVTIPMYCRLSIAKLTRCLAQMPNLTYLRFFLGKCPDLFLNINMTNKTACSPLPSVTHVKFVILFPIAPISSALLETIFPNSTDLSVVVGHLDDESVHSDHLQEHFLSQFRTAFPNRYNEINFHTVSQSVNPDMDDHVSYCGDITQLMAQL